MKKLLLVLSSLIVTSSASTVVISCGDKVVEKQNIESVERFLNAIIHSKKDDQNPWTNEALEIELVNQKIDVTGGITVNASDVIEEGVTTNKQQSIELIGNGNSKNNYKYSGSITLIYNFGGNKPAPKKKITKQELETTVAGLQNFLDTIYYKSESVVRNTFVANAKIPGTPAEGVAFNKIKVEILKANKALEPQFTYFKITGMIGIKNNDSDYYEFNSDVTDEDKTFSCTGTIVDPIIIENDVLTESKEAINKWIKDRNFNDFNDFKNQLLTQQQNVLGNKAILIDTISNLQISDSTANMNSIYWTNEVSVILKAESGYEFSQEIIEQKLNEIKTSVEILKIQSKALQWYVLTENNNNKHIEPQFIQFSANNNTSKVQKNYLSNKKITQDWNVETIKEQQKAFVESLAIFTGDDKDEKINKFINSEYFRNSTSFNYGSTTSESLFKVDEVLFFDKNQDNLNENLESVLGQTKSLSGFVDSSQAMTRSTIKNTQNTSYYVVFLTKGNDDLYTAANRTLNVLLQQITVVD
ncbi:hypothetical protein ESOMN_v1c04820 [Williamsoniiplasma somnilux]|uniref:Lipoprotein n=1 Tax=Williamsoniiplasma somnilux TaxID=215578 RepID=A0A2K8NYP6_9MOLU|nr:hypothetical protein [Williamsoniiplasma somnilux]ATZ18864.1 hypothetical protein ESOMN_v1c04820 [Williamsoniiplasma somnilux]